MRLLLSLILPVAALGQTVPVGPVQAKVRGGVLEIQTKATYPPSGKAYRDDPEAHAVWRYIAGFAPDVVVTRNKSLAQALEKEGRVWVGKAHQTPSPARLERERRLRRSPLEMARLLAKVYGQEFPDPVYIPAMALIARHRLGEDVSSLTDPYVKRKDPLVKVTASHYSGHLIFAELAGRNPAYLALVRRAADHAIGTQALHNEMSDSMFMGCPLYAQAWKLTGDARYQEAAESHFRFVQTLCRRQDGLYRHSPLSEAAWGRGNAFAALGMALMLETMPDAPGVLESFRALMRALVRYQDPVTGMFHQVIDLPSSYREYSATAMIGRAMQIGLRNGWLDRGMFGGAVRKAWEGVSARTGDDGVLLDVCESTGKQKSVQDYLDREAIWGRDPRGGGMAMLFAVEMGR